MPSLASLHPLTLIGAALEVVIVLVLYARGLSRNWPSLVAYCIGSLIFDATIYARHLSYSTWFWAYWIWTFVSALLRIWIMIDVIGSFPGGLVWPVRFQRALALACIVITAGACAMTFLSPISNNYQRMMAAIVIVDRAVATSWAAFLLASLIALWIMRLGWSAIGSMVCLGMMVRVGTALIFSISFSLHRLLSLGREISAYGALAALVLWLVAVTRDASCTEATQWYLAALEQSRMRKSPTKSV
jgi:hypothetical protein